MRLTWYISTCLFHYVIINKGIFLRNFYYCFIFSRGNVLENIICNNLSKKYQVFFGQRLYNLFFTQIILSGFN